MLKSLGILDTAAGLTSCPTKNNTAAAAVTATAEEAAAEGVDIERTMEEESQLDRAAPTTVSVVSKEQAMQLLIPDHEQVAKRSRSQSKSTGAIAIATTPQEASNLKPDVPEAGDSSLEGKFVNLVDLLLPMPTKGEFDVNKIKSSLYFFS